MEREICINDFFEVSKVSFYYIASEASKDNWILNFPAQKINFIVEVG